MKQSSSIRKQRDLFCDVKISDKYGGWLGEQVVDDFADYARVCYKAFGDLVNFWITINEPHVVAHQGSNRSMTFTIQKFSI